MKNSEDVMFIEPQVSVKKPQAMLTQKYVDDEYYQSHTIHLFTIHY